MIAYAVNSKGLREVVGFKAYPNESTETWTDFLSGLRQRGLTDPRMIISDAKEDLSPQSEEYFRLCLGSGVSSTLPEILPRNHQ